MGFRKSVDGRERNEVEGKVEEEEEKGRKVRGGRIRERDKK